MMLFSRPVFATTLCTLLASTGAATSQGADLPGISPDVLQFSVDNMDRSVDPAQDFYRYASGGWLDRVERPADKPVHGIFYIMTDRLKKQVAAAAAEAGAKAAEAPKGSPTQLVGDFYNAFMNVEAIDAAGVEPIRAMLDEVDAVADFRDLTRVIAVQAASGGPGLFAMFGPSQDPTDGTRHAYFSLGQSFGIHKNFQEALRGEADSPTLTAYRTFINDLLLAAGYESGDAARVANLSLEIERQLYGAFLTPAEAKDPTNKLNRKSYEDVKAIAPEVDIDLYLDTIGFGRPDAFFMWEPHAFERAGEVWRTTPLEDLKEYVKYRIIQKYAPFLTSELNAASVDLFEKLVGARIDPPRPERIYDLFIKHLGHPTGQVYVEAYFSDDTKTELLDMIERIKAVFRQRLVDNDWLSEPTRAAALEKVDKFYYKVGYPDHWIDYSSVEIGPTDPVANMVALGAFGMERQLDMLTRPPEHEEFNGESTLPFAMNAAYSPLINGFEVTAAITQPPAFSADMDAPLKFCRIGAVIGHEMTHGFDFTGRQYDADGNFRNWWTDADAEAFLAEAQKLVDQANAYEVLPDVFVNGQLGVGENMADVGGITFAHAALMQYLDDHPEENVEIDGMSPSQRCFVAWTQLWTMKATDTFLKNLVVNDGHAPDFYRAVAALQHVDAWYETFGIEEGDPMWLPPEKRARAW